MTPTNARNALIPKLVTSFVAAAIAAQGAAHAMPEVLTPDDFSRLPTIEHPNLSLEGDMMIGL
ncbi:MAG: hypothetical protein VXW22_15345, partial [Pseudomonadota bacterium]|nr:hypothetical protein [Pseudomonadota bacterium]